MQEEPTDREVLRRTTRQSRPRSRNNFKDYFADEDSHVTQRQPYKRTTFSTRSALSMIETDD